MKVLLSADRIRSIVVAAGTEKELENTFRRHRIRFSWTTEPGYIAARVPCRSGAVLVYRTASRSAPFQVRPAAAPACCPACPVMTKERSYNHEFYL